MSNKWENRFDPRRFYGEKMCALGQQRSDFYILVADLAASFSLGEFINCCQGRCINTGIAEQNMVGIAAGLAMEGKIPWINSIAPFATLRCAEQIRTDLCYNNLHAVIVAVMGGISGAPMGATHYATDDLGVLRSFANITILSPADEWEIGAAMEVAMDAPGPVYIRLGGGTEPHLPSKRSRFTIGKAFTCKEGTDVALFATGYMVHKALDAAELLEGKGISAGVYDHHTIKPIDKESILEAAGRAKLVVTLEEHNIFGGLGSATAEVLADAGLGVRLLRLGIPDLYVGVGEREDLLAKYGLDGASVARRVTEVLKKK
jgi:transketolase